MHGTRILLQTKISTGSGLRLKYWLMKEVKLLGGRFGHGLRAGSMTQDGLSARSKS